MLKSIIFSAGLTAAMVVGFASSAARAEITTTVDDGGSVVTVISSDAAINRGSSLHRRWVTVHDSSLPLTLQGNTGVRTELAPSGTDGYYGFVSMIVSAKQPIAAFEVRVVLFNVWGDFLRTFTASRVTDLSAGDDRAEVRWRMFDPSEVGYVHSLIFVSRVMTQDGHVYVADDEAILAEARKISPRTTIQQLQPKKDIWLGGTIVGNSEISR